MKLYKGDCLEVMSRLPSASVDMIFADLPYGTTECAWDEVIPVDAMWREYRRLLKPGHAIVLTAAQPFTSVLVCSNIKMFKYQWVWEKSNVSHFAQAPYRPLTNHEDVLVFSDGGVAKNAALRMPYFPQGVTSVNLVRTDGISGKSEHRDGRKKRGAYTQTVTGYPKTIQPFASVHRTERLHGTQKPVDLVEFFIKTYSKPGELVLDNCMGSGTTGVACINTGRRFIGIEDDDKYFDIASKRIDATPRVRRQVSRR